jgi:endonuclease/exonuclease/phosphatase family metal-dependent hydrolase
MRILSYNIHKGIGNDRRYRIQRVIDVIRAEAPDIVCLQEVDRGVARSRYDDQPRVLASALGFPHALYQLNVRLRRGGYGNLILTRFPIRESHQISLRLRTKKPRGAQLATLDADGRPLHLVHWHLGLAEAERHWQMNHLLGHRCFRGAHHLPTVMIGDSNDWRNTLASGDLGREGFSLVTSPPSRFRSFPSYLAVGSLDKAFVRGGVRAVHARVANTRLARRASDHLPLVVDLAW